jgi:hypothetical protein
MCNRMLKYNIIEKLLIIKIRNVGLAKKKIRKFWEAPVTVSPSVATLLIISKITTRYFKSLLSIADFLLCYLVCLMLVSSSIMYLPNFLYHNFPAYFHFVCLLMTSVYCKANFSPLYLPQLNLCNISCDEVLLFGCYQSGCLLKYIRLTTEIKTVCFQVI